MAAAAAFSPAVLCAPPGLHALRALRAPSRLDACVGGLGFRVYVPGVFSFDSVSENGRLKKKALL
jgi:hypothetical protein